MSNYSKILNYSALADSDADPSVFDTEFASVATHSATKVDKTGSTMTGALSVPAGASGTQAVRANEIFNHSFPSGTPMAFFQASAPTGWTQDVTNDNAMLRVVSGSGGGTGGTDSPIAGLTITDAYTLLIADIPAHDHDYQHIRATGSLSIAGGTSNLGFFTDATTSTGGGGGHAHDITFAPKYLDMIIAVKD